MQFHLMRGPLAQTARSAVLTHFYREEFQKHQQCLREQREFFSEQAIAEVECALARIMAGLDRLCAEDNAPVIMSQLLQQFDVVTGLSAWSDPKNAH